MWKRILVAVLLAILASPGQAGTNTPFPAGTLVSVTTSAGTVTGTLEDVDLPEWIAIREAGSAGVTYVRGTGVIVRGAVETARDAALRPRVVPVPRTLEARGSAGHFVYGQPRVTDDRFRFTPPGHDEEVAGITYHVREAFTLGHYNRMKVPAWVAMRWTTDDFDRSEAVSLGRPEPQADPELPLYAQTGKDLDFPVTKLERGHMARDADLEAWGQDAVAEGVLMSNICPQRQGRNHAVWGKLEDQHREIVADPEASGIPVVWVVSGPFYDDDDGDGEITEDELTRVGDDGVAVPDGPYKVIAWEDAVGDFHRAQPVVR